MAIISTDILIIGAGLSGLSSAWQLQQKGADFHVVEARAGTGGRCRNFSVKDVNYDLGPSWFWPGQELIRSHLSAFGIQVFPQFDQGNFLFQTADLAVHSVDQREPMSRAYRIDGGVKSLVDAFTNAIPVGKLHLNSQVTSLKIKGDKVFAEVMCNGELSVIKSRLCAIAIPPRLVPVIEFEPKLADQILKKLQSTPTWMAAHAKFLAVYDKPFWRQSNLCGGAFSHCGPLREVHDASDSKGKYGALTGFISYDSAKRKTIGRAQLESLIVTQLQQLFGGNARCPLLTQLVDWSTEYYTASQFDTEPLQDHPSYGFDLDAGEIWNDRVKFISAETSFSDGGLMEGALQRGKEFASFALETSCIKPVTEIN